MKDNEMWSQAKNTVRSMGYSRDWTLVAHVYHELGGSERSIFVYLDTIKYKIIGYANVNKTETILEDFNTSERIVLNSETVIKSRKIFK